MIAKDMNLQKQNATSKPPEYLPSVRFQWRIPSQEILAPHLFTTVDFMFSFLGINLTGWCCSAAYGKRPLLGGFGSFGGSVDWETRRAIRIMANDLRCSQQVLWLHSRCYHCHLRRMAVPRSVHTLGGFGSSPPLLEEAVNWSQTPGLRIINALLPQIIYCTLADRSKLYMPISSVW